MENPKHNSEEDYKQIQVKPIVIAVFVFLIILVVFIGFESDDEYYSLSSTQSTQTATKETPKTVEDMSLTAMQEDNEIFTVETNFDPSDPNLVLSVGDQEYKLIETAKSSDDKYSLTFNNVHIPLLGENDAKIILASGESYSFIITRTLSTTDEWRKYIDVLDYKVLKKDADRYAGENIRGSGQIIQIIEDSGKTEGIIGTTSLGYGYWDDNIYFVYDGLTDFVEEDVVDFYGVIVGDYTYPSVAGWTITVPLIAVEIIE